MRIKPQEISDALEAMEHRRSRLSDLLHSGSLSVDLTREIEKLLIEVDAEMKLHKPRTWVTTERIAA